MNRMEALLLRLLPLLPAESRDTLVSQDANHGVTQSHGMTQSHGVNQPLIAHHNLAAEQRLSTATVVDPSATTKYVPK